MTHPASTMKTAPGPARQPRYWLRGLGAIAAFAIIQSVTITPAIRVRYVDAASGAPLVNLPVTAVWHLHAATPAGSLRSTVLKVQRRSTNAKGEILLGTAVLPHAPLFPFGFGVRQARSLPTLYAVDDEYASDIAASASEISGERIPWSFLSVQRTSINGSTNKLSRLDQNTDPTEQRREGDFREMIEHDVYQAVSSCGKRLLCQMGGE